MADNYEVLSQSESLDIGADGNLVQQVHVTAKAIPSGAIFSIAMPSDGFSVDAVHAELDAKAQAFNAVASL